MLLAEKKVGARRESGHSSAAPRGGGRKSRTPPGADHQSGPLQQQPSPFTNIPLQQQHRHHPPQQHRPPLPQRLVR